MNLHGYKKHLKGIKNMLEIEKHKPKSRQNQLRINRLENSRHNCQKRIRALKIEKERRNKKKKEKRKFRKLKKR